MRGHLIVHVVGKRRERDREVSCLETNLNLWEADYIANPHSEILRRIEQAREEYRCLFQQEARTQYRAQQGRLYEVGNKAGKLLAWLARRDEEQRWISGVFDTSGTPVETAGQIAQTFADFLRTLYMS